jgi:hypothetical protein
VEPLGPDVERELSRFGPQAGLGEAIAAWPGVVGEAIARNAWPARFARDGTLHVATKDAVWAFELGHRAAEIAERLGVQAVRFSPGKVADALPAEATAESLAPRPEPTAEERLRAAEIAAPIEDEELRDLVARAVAASLSNQRDDRPF